MSLFSLEATEITSLRKLREAEAQCTRCPLYRNATQVVPGEGPTSAALMLVGEQPGNDEDLAGKPFVGPAGRVLDRALADAGLDRNKVNVNGGAMALGHPIGATGAILIGTMLDELERRDLRRGLVTMCAAGGMAPAIIIERV